MKVIQIQRSTHIAMCENQARTLLAVCTLIWKPKNLNIVLHMACVCLFPSPIKIVRLIIGE